VWLQDHEESKRKSRSGMMHITKITSQKLLPTGFIQSVKETGAASQKTKSKEDYL
jgi:hypothetical protein